MKVRTANGKDIESLTEMEYACSGTMFDSNQMRRLLHPKYEHFDRNCIVCEESGEKIGFAIFDTNPIWHLVDRIFVYPEFRMEGAGTRMIQKMKQGLSFGRRQFISASVPTNNVDACLFFDSMGFLSYPTIDGLIPFIYRYHPEVDGGMSTLRATCRQIRNLRKNQ